MLNRILSKKIKSPLSLRGAFPHVIARERSDRSNLNLSGFSLIELMVAVVILAIAVLGIFLAFSNGWMGMADSRDRTVATNYAQEILEDIKNTPFEKIHPEYTSQIGDTKFYSSITLNPNTNPNIKEVTAQVTWNNWRGSEKNVEASTLIYSQISSEETSEAVALVLYAEPYYNILPFSSYTVLTALVKDVNGNLVTDWGELISFSVEYHDPSMGDLSQNSVMPVNGMATGVIFTSSGEFGDAIIVASSEGLRNDSVTLKITDRAVAIKLEADPATIFTGGQSTINVSLLDANYEVLYLEEGSIDEHLVTLNVKEGPGTITGQISVLLNEGNGGISSITLTSTGDPGIVTIVAISMDLESGLVNIPIIGSAELISITAIPPSINLSEDTNITITIIDSAGNSVLYSGSINLSLSISNGILSGEDYVGGVLTFLYESSKTITYAPSDAGEVNITASALSGGLSSGTVTIYISEGRKIKLTAEPESIIADGESISTITATIRDMGGDIVTDGNYQIVFEILSGEGNLSEYFKTTTLGVASINLTSTISPSTITVIARGVDLTSDSVTVKTTIPKFIAISADKDWLYVGEGAVISIDVVDSGGVSVAYEGLINLTLSDPESGSLTSYALSYPGEYTADFTALSNGEVTITADGDFINSDFVTIPILEKITFEDNIIILDSGNTITFDIRVGGVDLEIEQMNITWDSLSTLNKICFSTPGTCFSYEPVGPGDFNVEPTTLPSGLTTISLYFNGFMTERTITVIFYDSHLVPYPLEEFTIQ